MDDYDEEIMVLDGSPEENILAMKKFFGLRPDQTFQDLDVDISDWDDDEDDEDEKDGRKTT